MNFQKCPMTVRLFSQISDLENVPWEDITPPRAVALSRGMLRTMAIARPKPTIYLTVWHDDKLVAGTAAYFIAPSTSPSRWLRLDVLMGDAFEASGVEPPSSLASSLMPTLYVGAHASNNEWLLTRPGLSLDDRHEAIKCLLDAAETAAREGGCQSISFPYIDPNDQELNWLLEQRGFTRFPSMWSCSLDVKWDSFQAYLDTLSSRRRNAIQRERRLIVDSGFSIAEEPLTDELAREFELLKGNIDAKYHGEEARRPLTETSYTPVLARECGDKVFAITARKNGLLVASVVAIRAGDTVISAMWGGDYNAIGSVPLYYEIGYYRIIEYAANHRLHRIEIGPTAYRAKLSRGFKPIRSDGWVRIFDPATHQRIADATAKINVEAAWKACHDGM